MSDEKRDDTYLWIVISALLLVVIAITLGVDSEVSTLKRRVGQLEEHSRALTSACALDAEVKDIDRRVKALEAERLDSHFSRKVFNYGY